MECCYKTLEEFLDESCVPYLDSQSFLTRLGIAYQIIRGIHVLHNIHKLIHRNLSLRSIHVCNDQTVKIGDLGLASECKEILREEAPARFSLGAFPRPVSLQDLPKRHESVRLHAEKEEIFENHSRIYMSPEQGLKGIYNQKVNYYCIILNYRPTSIP